MGKDIHQPENDKNYLSPHFYLNLKSKPVALYSALQAWL